MIEINHAENSFIELFYWPYHFKLLIMKKQFQDRGFGGDREIKELVRTEMINIHKTLRAKNSKVFSHA